MKYLILIILMFFVSGCSVDYNLEITKDNIFKENVTINSDTQEESNQIYSYVWPLKINYNDPDVGDNPIAIEGVEYYESKSIKENDLYNRQFTYNYDLKEIGDANLINSCYENFYVTENEDNTITLSTTGAFKCMQEYENLNQVNINIKVANPVVASNASSVDGKNYKWTITKDNYETSGIIITFKKDNVGSGDYKSNILVSLGILGAFLIFIGGIIFYNIKKNK